MNSRNSGNYQPPQLPLCYRIKFSLPKTPCTAMRSTHHVCIRGWSVVLREPLLDRVIGCFEKEK